MENRKFSLENLGCAKNQVDAEYIVTLLEERGWTYTDDPDQAAVILINSCGFIEPAKEESVNTALRLREEHPGAGLFMIGCLAQRYGSELTAVMGELDGVCGNLYLPDLPDALREWEAGRRPVVVRPLQGLEEGGEAAFPERRRFFNFPGSAYLKITEGCDNRCAFCAIPLIRGGLRSRPADALVSEFQGLLAKGVQEVNLIGQDLGNYGKDTAGEAPDLTGLVRRLSAAPGRYWLRMLYIHPDHFPRDLFALCRDDSRILPYFDIPFQHASEAVLRRMGRKGSFKSYRTLVETIRRELPSAVIRSTFLIGFPGETEEDRELLRRFIEEVRLDWAGTFLYSREEGTASYDSETEEEFRRRVEGLEGWKEELQNLQNGISQQRMQDYRGRTLDVLIEEEIKGEELYIGRAYLQAPEVDGLVVVNAGDLTPGEMVSVEVVRVNGFDLEGYPV